MLLKTLVYKKKDLTTVTETSTLEEALKNFRNFRIPLCADLRFFREYFPLEIFTKCTSIVIKQTAVI